VAARAKEPIASFFPTRGPRRTEGVFSPPLRHKGIMAGRPDAPTAKHRPASHQRLLRTRRRRWCANRFYHQNTASFSSREPGVNTRIYASNPRWDRGRHAGDHYVEAPNAGDPCAGGLAGHTSNAGPSSTSARRAPLQPSRAALSLVDLLVKPAIGSASTYPPARV